MKGVFEMIIKQDKDTIINYLTDASNIKGEADCVYIPETQDELIALVANLYNQNIKISLSAGGTGMAGGRVPDGGVVISVENLNRIIRFDKDNGIVTVESGLVLKDLQDYLETENYFYPPNPTENNSMIAGNIANNSSGSRTFKYGATREYVKRLKIVLADGSLLELKRNEIYASNSEINLFTNNDNRINIPIDDIYKPNAKNASGYYVSKDMDAIDLFIGNEGTLGIIIEADLAVIPSPEKLIGAVTFFESESGMLNFVDYMRDISFNSFIHDYSSFGFRLIEYFDYNALELLKPEYSQIPSSAKYAIWFEQEARENNLDELLEEINNVIYRYSSLADETWIALSDKEHKDLSEFRHKLPLLITDKISSKEFRKIGGDTSVPLDKFREYYLRLYKLYESSGINFVIFGHIGNAHLHADIFPQTQEEFDRALDIYEKLIEMTLEYKGSVSAEHGIGKVKKKYLSAMMGEVNINIMKNIKMTLDEKLLLSKGNLFDFC